MQNEIKKPIFIVGCPRSGTTILARILNNHSKIASATETHFFNHLIKIPKYDWNKVDDDFLKDFFNETRIEDFCSLLNVSFEEFKTQFDKTSSESNKKRVFDTLMLILLEKNNKSICCEKTPQHLLNVDEILKIYPDAKIIHLIRDGRDTVNSLVKMPWRPEGLLNNSRFWKQYAKIGMNLDQKYKEQQSNYHSLKYEDLLLNPVESLKALCAFIGEDFEKEMLSSQKTKINDNSNIFSSWESSWKLKAMEEIDSTRVGVWQKELDDKDQRLLNWHLGKELALLGYEDAQLKLDFDDWSNICAQYMSLFTRRLTRSITDLIS